ncbi:MAG: cytochrome c [Ghiorsea sp.]
MKKTTFILSALAALSFMSAPAFAEDGISGPKIFKKKCKMCHAMDRKRVGTKVSAMPTDAAVLKNSITNGKGRMPKFGHKLSSEEIDAVVAFLQESQAKLAE